MHVCASAISALRGVGRALIVLGILLYPAVYAGFGIFGSTPSSSTPACAHPHFQHRQIEPVAGRCRRSTGEAPVRSRARRGSARACAWSATVVPLLWQPTSSAARSLAGAAGVPRHARRPSAGAAAMLFLGLGAVTSSRRRRIGRPGPRDGDGRGDQPIAAHRVSRAPEARALWRRGTVGRRKPSPGGRPGASVAAFGELHVGESLVPPPRRSRRAEAAMVVHALSTSGASLRSRRDGKWRRSMGRGDLLALAPAATRTSPPTGVGTARGGGRTILLVANTGGGRAGRRVDRRSAAAPALAARADGVQDRAPPRQLLEVEPAYRSRGDRADWPCDQVHWRPEAWRALEVRAPSTARRLPGRA